MKHDIVIKGVWHKIHIKDKTKVTLKNGAIIPSWSAMVRQASKI